MDKAQLTHAVALKCRRLRRHHCCHQQRVGSNTARRSPSPITETWGATQSKTYTANAGSSHAKRTGPMIVACQWKRSSPAGPAEQFDGGSRPRSCSSSTHTAYQCQRPSSSIITEQQGGTAARTQEPPDSERPNTSVSFSKEATRGRMHSLRGTSMASLRPPPQRRENNRGPWSGPGHTRRTQVTRSTQTRAGARKRTGNTLQRHDASSLRKKTQAAGRRTCSSVWRTSAARILVAAVANLVEGSDSKQAHQRQSGSGRPPMPRWRCN